jgi:hypothetical protein
MVSQELNTHQGQVTADLQQVGGRMLAGGASASCEVSHLSILLLTLSSPWNQALSSSFTRRSWNTRRTCSRC